MIYYKVANHIFGIIYPKEPDINTILPSYQNFRIKKEEVNEELLFSLKYYPYNSLSGYQGTFNQSGKSDLGDWTLYENEENYIIDIEYYEGMPRHRMVSTKDFKICNVAILMEDPYAKAIFNSFISMAYAQACSLKNTIVIHASTILKDGFGYAFLGKSGTGKSTHSNLWLQHIPGTDLLNDDNPAIRVYDNGSIIIYGTPWSGKTPCYKNKEVQLGGVVQLKQATENKIQPLRGIEAYLILLSSTSSIKDNPVIGKAVGNTIEKIINMIQVYYLQNLPNKEAAILCYKTLVQNNK